MNNTTIHSTSKDALLNVFSLLSHDPVHPAEGLKQLAILSQVSKAWKTLFEEDKDVKERLYQPLLLEYAKSYPIDLGEKYNWKILAEQYVNKSFNQVTYKTGSTDFPLLTVPPSPCKIMFPGELPISIFYGPGFTQDWFFVNRDSTNILILMNGRTHQVISIQNIDTSLTAIEASPTALFLGFANGTIKSFDANTGEIRQDWSCKGDPGQPIKKLMICEELFYSISNWNANTIKIWDLLTGMEKTDNPLIIDPKYTFFSRNKNYVVAYSEDSIWIQDLQSKDWIEKIFFDCSKEKRLHRNRYNLDVVKSFPIKMDMTEKYIVVIFGKYLREIWVSVFDYQSDIKKPLCSKRLMETPINRNSLYYDKSTFSVELLKIKGAFVYATFADSENNHSLAILDVKRGALNINPLDGKTPGLQFLIEDKPEKLTLRCLEDKKIVSHSFDFSSKKPAVEKIALDKSSTDKEVIPEEKKGALEPPRSGLIQRIAFVFRSRLKSLISIFASFRALVLRHKRIAILTGFAIAALAMRRRFQVSHT